MSYHLSRAALRDLTGALDYITKEFGVSRAIMMHERFARAFGRIASSPHIGIAKPHVTRRKVRWLTMDGFLIVYSPRTNPVTILRIVHGSRDVARWLR